MKGSEVVFRVLSSHGEQIVHRDGEFIHRIVAQVRANECGIEAIEAGTDGGMCSEKISGSRDVHGKVERLLVILHVAACPLKNGECRMSFVEVTDLRRKTQCSQQAPSADAEDDLLLQTHLCVPAIELAGDTAMSRCIGKVVGIEKIQLCSSH